MDSGPFFSVYTAVLKTQETVTRSRRASEISEPIYGEPAYREQTLGSFCNGVAPNATLQMALEISCDISKALRAG